MKKRTETLDVNIKVPGNQYDLFTETRDGWFRVYLRESMTPETGERKIVEVGKARVAEYTADCEDFYLGGGKYASPNSEPDCYTGEPLDPEDFLRAAAKAHVLDMTEDWEWPRGVRRSAREAAERRLAEELRNQADWIVHVHAENINRWSKTDVLAIPKSDPFGTFARFAETPGWTESEPLAVQEIEADSKEEAADKLFDLGVTRENLWALDLGVES